MRNADCRNSEYRDAQGLSAGGRETPRLRLFFLTPLTLMILTAVGLLVFILYHHEQEELQSGVARVQTSAMNLYQGSIRSHTEALQTLLEILERDRVLHAALEHGDRVELLKKSAPLLADMYRMFGVTHMYFTRPDRVNLLRVHQPEIYGDVINRFTTRKAELTGTEVQGLELGPLGTFTLRVVDPWYADGQKQQLYGYVELGMEIDRALATVREFLNVQTFVLIRKEFLQREGWESGMKELGRTPEWERFPDFVLSTQGMQTIPDALAKRISNRKLVESAAAIIHDGPISYRSIVVPLRDAANVEVGDLVILVDISHETDSARRVVVLSGMTALVAGGVLFGFFYWLVGRIGAQLESQRKTMADLAMYDGLTKLLNHRMFYIFLEQEVARTRRHKKSLSLLMLDIDLFKRVNDTYGHVAGDVILVGLGSVINEQVRNVDSVYRYGGEEIAVILPETGLEGAVLVAERIRSTIEGHCFDIGQGQNIGITVSIGVASLPSQEVSVEKLVAMADKVLYEAKEDGRNRVYRG